MENIKELLKPRPKRVVVKLGDIFEVPLVNGVKGYVQYIGDDAEQLNSTVIRIFKMRHPIESKPTVEDIVSGEVEFYAHITIIGQGVKDGDWSKYGNSKNVGNEKEVVFRNHAYYGLGPLPPVVNEWIIWRMNGKSQKFMNITDEQAKAHYGSVTWPVRVKTRMLIGKYAIRQPDYKENQAPSSRTYCTSSDEVQELEHQVAHLLDQSRIKFSD